MLNESGQPFDSSGALNAVVAVFHAKGWNVQVEPKIGHLRPDLFVEHGGRAYVVEVKGLSEGRADRVIPLLSQAILQSQKYAHESISARPLAIVYARNASPSLLKQVEKFAHDFAPEVAIGIISDGGAHYFIGDGLEDLSGKPDDFRKRSANSSRYASLSLSDLNQWMLKVLLAPDIPEGLLAAPRAEYRNPSELANAAKVSVMSASRFVQQLRNQGYLDESPYRLRLVRRSALYSRWRAEALRPSLEMPMCFLIRGSQDAQLERLLSNHSACLGMFAAAQALNLGHVVGVLPYIYASSLPGSSSDPWSELVSPRLGEKPHVILRKAIEGGSVFRGAVRGNGVAVSDVIQIWLDVSAHPSRGEEQAELIWQKYLGPVINRKN